MGECGGGVALAPPGGHVAELQRHVGQSASGVERGEFVGEQVERPAVAEDVVQDQAQDVVVGAVVRAAFRATIRADADQRGPQRRCCGEVDRRVGAGGHRL